MEKNKKRTFAIILGMHVLLGFIHLLLFNLGHPLTKYTKDLPLFFQVLAVSVFAIIVYMIASYIMMVGLNRDLNKIQYLDQSLIVISLILFVVFLITYAFFVFNEKQSVWLVYSLFNPLFGTAMFNQVKESMWSILWGFSAFAPGIGIIFGTYLSQIKGGK